MAYELAGNGSVFLTTNNGVSVYMAKIRLKESTTGETITVSGTGSTRKQAVERRDQNVAKRLRKLAPDLQAEDLPVARTRLRARKSSLTPSQYLPHWQRIQGSRTKPQTKAKQEQRLKQWIYPWLDIPMDRLTKPQLEAHFFTTLPAAGAGPTSTYDAYCALKALLRSAHDNGFLKQNPAASLRMKKPRPKVREADDVLIGKRLRLFEGLTRELSDPSHEHHAQYPLVLLLGLGLRRAEILGVTWDCFTNLGKKNHAVLTLRQQLIRSPEGEYFIQPSLKNGKTRRIPLPEEHRVTFKELKATRGAKGSDLLFTGADGGFLKYTSYNRLWEKVLKTYLTKDGRELRDDDFFRAHFCRAIVALKYARAGVDVTVAAKLLGHDPYVLLQSYSRPAGDDLREAVQALR